MTAGFGLERLGLVTLKYPRATLMIVAVMVGIFIFGAQRVGFSSDIREIFRSGSTDFLTLEEAARQYPGSDRDILIVVEGPELFTARRLDALRSLHLELSLLEGVNDVLSMFSARKPPDAQGNAESLFPPEMADVQDLAALKRQLQEHPLVSGRLLSEDGQLALIVISLANNDASVDELRNSIADAESATKELLEATELTFTLTGTAVMRVEIIGALIRDQQKFRYIGLAVSVLLCLLFFRSIGYSIIALAPAGLGVLGLKGGMGLVGQDVNVLNNIIASLVLVIAFASALHMLFAIRRKCARGSKVDDAIADAVKEVGPACVLTAATTCLALLSLLVVPHPFIRNFGLTAALGTAFTYVAIMVTVPPLCRLLLGRFTPKQVAGGADRIQKFFEVLSDWAARLVRTAPGSIAAVGVVLTMVAGVLYMLNEPRYQYQDNLPKDTSAFQAIEHIDTKLSGTNTIRLLIQWPKDYKVTSPQTLDVVREAHEIMQSEPILARVSSLNDVTQWYVQGGRPREDLFAFLEKTNTPLTRRVISPEHHSALITGYFGSIPAAQLVTVLNRLDTKLDALRKRYPSLTFATTGLVPVSAKASTEMINQLNRSILGAMVVIIILIGLAFRSVAAGLFSILPNVLPVFLAGAALYLFDRGLQFTSVVAFTIGFGIAVDSTIHVFNRYRLERDERGNVADALELTIHAIGPVLIVSTLVLICGIGGTILSELPMVRLYGEVIVLLLMAALLGDLLFLPALISMADKLRARKSAPDEPAGPRPAKRPTT